MFISWKATTHLIMLIFRNGKIRSNRDIVLHRQRPLIYGLIDLNHSIDSIISFDHQVVLSPRAWPQTPNREESASDTYLTSLYINSVFILKLQKIITTRKKKLRNLVENFLKRENR